MYAGLKEKVRLCVRAEALRAHRRFLLAPSYCRTEVQNENEWWLCVQLAYVCTGTSYS